MAMQIAIEQQASPSVQIICSCFTCSRRRATSKGYATVCPKVPAIAPQPSLAPTESSLSSRSPVAQRKAHAQARQLLVNVWRCPAALTHLMTTQPASLIL